MERMCSLWTQEKAASVWGLEWEGKSNMSFAYPGTDFVLKQGPWSYCAPITSQLINLSCYPHLNTQIITMHSLSSPDILLAAWALQSPQLFILAAKIYRTAVLCQLLHLALVMQAVTKNIPSSKYLHFSEGGRHTPMIRHSRRGAGTSQVEGCKVRADCIVNKSSQGGFEQSVTNCENSG